MLVPSSLPSFLALGLLCPHYSLYFGKLGILVGTAPYLTPLCSVPLAAECLASSDRSLPLPCSPLPTRSLCNPFLSLSSSRFLGFLFLNSCYPTPFGASPPIPPAPAPNINPLQTVSPSLPLHPPSIFSPSRRSHSSSPPLWSVAIYGFYCKGQGAFLPQILSLFAAPKLWGCIFSKRQAERTSFFTASFLLCTTILVTASFVYLHFACSPRATTKVLFAPLIQPSSLLYVVLASQHSIGFRLYAKLSCRPSLDPCTTRPLASGRRRWFFDRLSDAECFFLMPINPSHNLQFLYLLRFLRASSVAPGPPPCNSLSGFLKSSLPTLSPLVQLSGPSCFPVSLA